MNKPIIISNVTPDHVAAMLAELSADKATRVVSTPGVPNEYEILGHGIVAKATYSPTAQALTVNVSSKPWVVTMGEIESELTAALGSPDQKA